MILEGKLLEIIAKVKIPVPLDFAITDQKKMPDNALRAIQDAIALHTAATTLKMNASQVASFTTNGVTMVGKFLAHYATGSTSTFTSAALNQVLKAIDDLAQCFQIEVPVGSGNWKYFKSLDKIS